MQRRGTSFITRAALIMAVIGASAGGAVAAQRNVLGEYFTATW